MLREIKVAPAAIFHRRDFFPMIGSAHRCAAARASAVLIVVTTMIAIVAAAEPDNNEKNDDPARIVIAHVKSTHSIFSFKYECI